MTNKNKTIRISILLVFLWVGLLIVLFSVSSFISHKDVLKPASPYTLKYPANFGGRFTIPEDNPTTQEGVQLGRALFYEELLSSNGTISCANCHQQKLAFTDGQKFSVGVDGTLTKRNSMSLANLLWVRNFFWDGRAASLEAQAAVPLTDAHEMGQSLEVSSKKLQQTERYPLLFEQAFGTKEITGDRITKAIAQFERTLISANSKYDLYLQGTYTPTEQELNGLTLFSRGPQAGKVRGANCVHCHGSPKTFIELFHNNGLDKAHTADPGRESFTNNPVDRGRFRVATLRNIALTAPYMHDGRFQTLNEVLDHYSDHIQTSETLSAFVSESNEINGSQLALTKEEKSDIISFLHMLTDTEFISNPEFSDPNTTK